MTLYNKIMVGRTALLKGLKHHIFCSDNSHIPLQNPLMFWNPSIAQSLQKVPVHPALQEHSPVVLLQSTVLLATHLHSFVQFIP